MSSLTGNDPQTESPASPEPRDLAQVNINPFSSAPRHSNHSNPDLTDPLVGLRNSIFMGIGLTNVPEFRGAPREDVEKFLSEFGRATTTLSPEQKCVALRKALVGDASIFSKNYLKCYLSQGKWKEAKELLRKRFSLVDPSILYRTQLNTLSFDPTQSTLLGYVDRYAKLYKKIHPNAGTNELIQDLSLNLGQNIVLKLNHLSADWRSISTFEDFRSLISRLERDIMALESGSASNTTRELVSTVNHLVNSALQPPLKEFHELVGRLSLNSPRKQPQENLAGIKHGGYPPRHEERPPRNSGKRREREWDAETPQRQSRRRPVDLRKAYEAKFGELTGPCFLCGGQHFRRHCPLDMPDLNDLKGQGDAQ